MKYAPAKAAKAKGAARESRELHWFPASPALMVAVASSAWDQPGSSAQHGAADDEMLFPPSDASLMRGYLKADLPGGKFWFVLSQVPCRTAPKCPPTHQ